MTGCSKGGSRLSIAITDEHTKSGPLKLDRFGLNEKRLHTEQRAELRPTRYAPAGPCAHAHHAARHTRCRDRVSAWESSAQIRGSFGYTVGNVEDTR
jgi:hypothetical protein